MIGITSKICSPYLEVGSVFDINGRKHSMQTTSPPFIQEMLFVKNCKAYIICVKNHIILKAHNPFPSEVFLEISLFAQSLDGGCGY